jgi:hypothetical protein
MAPEQDTIMDYYGNKEYVGKDPYGHFHKPRPDNSDTIYPAPDILSVTNTTNLGTDLYSTPPPHEKN